VAKFFTAEKEGRARLQGVTRAPEGLALRLALV
jgi:hypothetical protein